MRKQLMLMFSLMSIGGTLQADCACPIDDATVFCQCECRVNAHTFFSVRPQFQKGNPERESAFYDRDEARQDGNGGAFQVAIFGGKSTNCGQLATYFMPICSNLLVVRENQVSGDDTNVIAGYFNVKTVDGTFESTIRFATQQSVVGAGFEYKQRFAEQDSGRAFWFDISIPVERVRNSMGFTETILNDGGGVADELPGVTPFVANMAQAFDQPSWNCGKIQVNDCFNVCGNSCSSGCSSSCNDCDDNCLDDCGMEKTGVADIDILFGYEFRNTEMCFLESYIGVLIATGNRVTSTNLFNPIVGHNHHTGMELGSAMRLNIHVNEERDSKLFAHFNLHGLYLFEANENRLVPVANKPWSQYMKVYANKEQAQLDVDSADVSLGEIFTPGVNVFCQCVKVKPGFQYTYNTALVYSCGRFQGEAGYNFFVREAECVDLAKRWQTGPAFKAIFLTSDADNAGQTNGVQMIDDNFNNVNALAFADYDNNLIKATDLDLDAASHPATVANILYAAIGGHWDERDYPAFVSVGGSYEFSRDNTVMDRWLAWGKAGISF